LRLLPLRARMKAEDGVAVVGGDVRGDRARRGENVRDVVPGAAGIEAGVTKTNGSLDGATPSRNP
jgi:hypothetical protein